MPMENNNKKGAFIWDLIKFCLISLAIVLPFRLFIAQPFIVSGKSMYPTFDNGQYLIVDELSYRLNPPTRGDVIIFHFPKNIKEYFIKRIVGLPNETIEITGGKIKITNAENPKGFFLNETYIVDQLSDMAPLTLSPTDYFVMGDNRGASYDSRAWGTLPKDLIVGRALVRLVPFKNAGLFPGKHVYTNE